MTFIKLKQIHKKVIIAIVLVGVILVWGLTMSKPVEPVKKDTAQSSNLEVVPTCEELNLPQEQIDEAVAEAVADLENPWGNESDFQLLLDRIKTKLGCTLKQSNGVIKAENTQ